MIIIIRIYFTLNWAIKYSTEDHINSSGRARRKTGLQPSEASNCGKSEHEQTGQVYSEWIDERERKSVTISKILKPFL